MLVDSGVDPVDFITASEESLKADLETAKVLTKAGSDPQVGVRREGRRWVLGASWRREKDGVGD